jgi:GH15 family glucan-1,4-alpha-glucosidase
MDLFRHSIEVIKKNQNSSGAFIACPNFSTYHYCWLRDGSFIAHAMDTAGEYDSATAYFRWVGNTIQKYGGKLVIIRDHLKKGIRLGKDDFLHTRFTLEGNEDTEDAEWGNFQIDGYGTWLWALAEHIRLSGQTELLKELDKPISITLQYLDLVWQLPNYDCWEEHPEYLHPYTLSTVYGGLDAVDVLVKEGLYSTGVVDLEYLKKEVLSFLVQHAVVNGGFVKHVNPASDGISARPFAQSGVDSSLLGIAVPYRVLPLDAPLVKKTVQLIEKDLHRAGGGVYRYKEDVFYGGGEWILLSAWLGWYYALDGKVREARDLLQWIESQADAEGSFAEQMTDHPLAPQEYEPWLKKWGPVAKPLLWSHAMYIILKNAIDTAEKG